MASSPAFASTPQVGSASLGTFDTSLTGPTNYSTIITAGSSGMKINEIVVQGTGTTVAAVVNLFVHDGTNWSLVDQVLISAVTSSTTAVAYRAVRQYANLFLENGWTLRASHTVTGNDTNKLRVTAFGADL